MPPQIEIDPAQIGQDLQEITITVLPDAARHFGYVPDFRRCKAGDLILFRYREPSFFVRAISSIQSSAGFGNEHSRWTHAAIFLDEDFIAEAVPTDGVRARTLYTDIPNKVLRVRRKVGLSDIDGHRIALRALRMLGTRYSAREAISLGWRMRSGLWTGRASRAFGTVVICSKIFYDAYVEITRSLLAQCPVDVPVTPAHLSATDDLQDIEIPWLKLRKV